LLEQCYIFETVTDRNEERRRRAQERSTLPGHVIIAGEPKPALYAELSLEARLERMAALCAAQWQVSGGELRQVPRGALPGEIFECHRG
jgi:hypothetical protein